MDENNSDLFYMLCTDKAIRTVGLIDYGSLEFECGSTLDLPFSPNAFSMILNRIGNTVCEGESYTNGKIKVPDFKTPMYLLERDSEVSEGQRVMKVIVPDYNKKYPWDDDCAPVYKAQITESEITIMKEIYNG